jgi:hypothetical protein|tara:strand:+ start:2636 stop:2797 length:162 start_codon:yes stop_codon:yes gene_type:complete
MEVRNKEENEDTQYESDVIKEVKAFGHIDNYALVVITFPPVKVPISLFYPSNK